MSSTITEAHYLPAIEVAGRGWVVELDGVVVAFAVGNEHTGNIWALFVDPEHERRGYGRRLHDVMVAWPFSRGLEKLWLATGPNTRAQGFYEVAGWQFKGMATGGDARYELLRGPLMPAEVLLDSPEPGH